MQYSTWTRYVGLVGFVFLLGLTPGCKRIVANTGFSVAKDAAAGVATLHDFDAADKMSYAGIAQLEGLYVVSPDNETGLSLLMQGWLGLGQAFIFDEYERALEAGNDRLAEYERQRARAAFERAKFYGLKLLTQRADGFEEAARNGRTFRPWLEANFRDPEDAPDLLWLGATWLGRVATDAERVSAIADLWIGVLLVEHAARLDETVEYGLAHMILGAYHARGAVAEMAQAKTEFDRALALSQGKYLMVQVQLAQRYYCQKHDRENYEATLRAVIEAKDPLPEARLQNTIAKRYAARYLGNPYWQEECGFELARSPSQ